MTSSKNRLILFTRYPEAGKTKTRLIPYLGAEKAADLQRQMTEHIVGTTRPLQVEGNLSMEVHFSGGSLGQMRNWLGTELAYRPQHNGDLGRRLQRAFEQGFRTHLERIVVIGADCPEITSHHLEQAFHQLKSHDVVLGPAQDGGYYLVGLSKTCAELFHGIAWGTEQVFRQTVAIARRLNLSLATLETLRDVDHPEDISIWSLCFSKLQSRQS
ncbi:MAG: TIGR04282 family arsenosugar biosynthesis glycosyltransferase [Leptolyngbya sp. SIO1E4]|nr:TIGR04282 family arsenosugar biosynthesis glycosyltransferase [Leptolyngbya sp. SIO1E4]